jgi:hypothetical protein
MQTLCEERDDCLKHVWKTYGSLELDVAKRCNQHYQTILAAAEKVKPKDDSYLFIRQNKVEWKEPSDYHFEYSRCWKEDVLLKGTYNS